jgi:hypothetical protein
MTGKRLRASLGIAFLGLVLSTGVAHAVTLEGCAASDCKPQTGEVMGEELTATAPSAAAPAAVAAESAPAGQLPFTGGDVAGLVAIGAVAVGAGTIMVRRSRATS